MIKRKDTLEPQTQALIQNYCPQGNYAQLVCCTPSCMDNAFICVKQKCKCLSLTHLSCNVKALENIIKTVNQRRNTINPTLFNLYDAIKTTYDESIKRLTADSKDLKKNMALYGLTSIEAQFYDLVMAKKWDKINGKFMSYLKDNLQAVRDKPPNIEQQIVEQLQETKKHFNIFCDSLKSMSCGEHIKSYRNTVPETQTQTVVYSLKTFQTVTQPVLRFQDIQIGSNIIQDSSFICQSFQKNVKSFKLLYRASQHDFSVEKYHSLCDQVPNSLVLLQIINQQKKQKKEVLGGYTPLKFSTSDNIGQIDISQTSFLFSLQNRSKFPLKKEAIAITSKKDFGPIFGDSNNPDLVICDKANIVKKSNCFNFPNSYVKDKKAKISYNSFYGWRKPPFYLKEWQVFQVSFN